MSVAARQAFVERLKEFRDAANLLTAAWDELEVSDLEATGSGYPKDWPSFDELAGGVGDWYETAKRAVGGSP